MKIVSKIPAALFMVLLLHNFSFSQWVQLASGTTTVLLDIEYVTAQNGGLVIACGSNGNLYRSSNSGTNWTEIQTGISTALADIEFIDAATGYAAGSFGVVIKTTNGGINWSALNTGTANDLTGATFITSAAGFICGSGTAAGIILKTTNGGANWNPCPVTTQANLIQSVFFIDASSGWAAGYNNSSFFGSILRTTNGGLSWQDVYVSVQPELFFDIHMLNSSSGFTSSSINISRTSNGGANLSPAFVPANAQLDIEFTNTLIGYSVGAPALVYKTTNGGINWFQQAAPGGSVPFRTVSMIGDTGFICGSNGTILKTTNGGQIPTSLTAEGNTVYNFSLGQNYPNPFNPETKISFNIPEPGFVQLKVYDMLGREISVPVSRNLGAGSYTVDFIAGRLTGGIYFYRITSGSFTDTKKMILIK